MLIVAEIDIAKAIGPALTSAIIPLVLGWLLKSAQSKSLATAGQRSLAYPKALKVFVIIGWIATVGIAILAGFTAKNADIKNAAAIVGLFVALILTLHLEAFGVRITWDDTHIHTRSPWRKARQIPFSAIRSCDYSQGLQWYRIHTDGYGTIRLHQFIGGIPELLAALPCPHPGYPPGTPSS
jgi:uncharacterized Tic20 family protein